MTSEVIECPTKSANAERTSHKAQEKMMTGIWKTWIDIWGWAMVGAGVLFALAAFPQTDFLARFFYETVDWPSTKTIVFDPIDYRLSVGLIGAIMIGWSLMMVGMIRLGHIYGRPIWQVLTTGFVAWWAIDSAMSVMLGFPINAVSNTVFLVFYLVPILGSGVLKPTSAAAMA
jgi:hypothetical protein